MLHLPISEFFLALAMMTGLVMYAFYYGCDPLERGVVAKGDQVRDLSHGCCVHEDGVAELEIRDVTVSDSCLLSFGWGQSVRRVVCYVSGDVTVSDSCLLCFR